MGILKQLSQKLGLAAILISNADRLAAQSSEISLKPNHVVNKNDPVKFSLDNRDIPVSEALGDVDLHTKQLYLENLLKEVEIKMGMSGKIEIGMAGPGFENKVLLVKADEEVNAANTHDYENGMLKTFIAVTTGMLDKLSASQVSAILAHELAHSLQKEGMDPLEAEYDADIKAARVLGAQLVVDTFEKMGQLYPISHSVQFSHNALLPHPSIRERNAKIIKEFPDVEILRPIKSSMSDKIKSGEEQAGDNPFTLNSPLPTSVGTKNSKPKANEI